MFRCDGDYWTIAYDGSVLRLKDSKGLQYIAYLLHHPGQELHALDLIMEVGGQESANDGHRARSDGAGPQLDAAAKAAYKARLEQLRDDLAEAEGFNDQGRIERVRTEIEGITQQLAAALGRAGADVELTDDILDRIDEIVAPGTEINLTDTMFVTPPAIADKRLRRR